MNAKPPATTQTTPGPGSAASTAGELSRPRWAGEAIIVAGVSLWCLIQAVGAYKTSPWLSVAVLGFLAVFLTLWGSVLWLRKRRQSTPAARRTQGATAGEWSYSGIASLALAMAAWAVYGLAVWGQHQTMAWQRVVSWIDILLLGFSVLAALVALSEPRPKRGKLGGLAALGLTLALVATVVFRLEPPRPTAAESSPQRMASLPATCAAGDAPDTLLLR